MSSEASKAASLESPSVEKNVDPTTTEVSVSNYGNESTILESVDPSDTLNPQNWSPWKKRMVFLALMSSSILADGYICHFDCWLKRICKSNSSIVL